MARAYPRFLFSNPKNTKSEGPFIVHTLQPFLIFKLNFDKELLSKYHNVHGASFGLILLNIKKENPIDDKSKLIMDEALVWFESQIIANAIGFSKADLFCLMGAFLDKI